MAQRRHLSGREVQLIALVDERQVGGVRVGDESAAADVVKAAGREEDARDRVVSCFGRSCDCSRLLIWPEQRIRQRQITGVITINGIFFLTD
jgi:hypothetical protein